MTGCLIRALRAPALELATAGAAFFWVGWSVAQMI